MENDRFEDVFPIEDGDFPASHVSLLECSNQKSPEKKKTGNGGKWNICLQRYFTVVIGTLLRNIAFRAERRQLGKPTRLNWLGKMQVETCFPPREN